MKISSFLARVLISGVLKSTCSKYNGPSITAGSKCADSTNGRSEIFEKKKILETSKKAKLNLASPWQQLT